MSYLVLARKWRPSVFENVIGQGHVTTTLKNAIASKRIAHAYIFSGPRGVGKTTVARILAKALNCADGPTQSPCNQCQSCREITGNISVDVVEIDGASNTSVDNVREIRENIKYLPSHGRYRVYIIDEVHMLSNPAFNALLKTLEEPPPHAIFIFATTEPHKIPATILSRCQRFDFKRIPLKDIQNHLKLVAEAEGIHITEGAIYLIAREVEGSLRDAHSLMDQVIAFAGDDIKESDVAEALGLMDRSILFHLAEGIVNKDGKACLKLVEKVYNFGYDLKRFCQDFLEHIRDMVIVKEAGGGKDILDMPDSEIEDLKKVADKISLPDLHLIFALLSKGYEDIVRSPSPRFSLEMTLLKMAHLENLQSINTILGRLADLKECGGSGGISQAADAGVAKKEGFSGKGVSGAERVVKIQNQATGAKNPSGSDSELVDFIRRKRPSLASHLEFANSFFVNGNTLSISIKDGPYFTYLSENKREMEQFCNEFFGREFVVDIKACKDAAISSKSGEDERIVKEALKAFGGKIIEERRSRPA